MTRADQEKLEQVETLLNKLQREFTSTYRQIHEILSSMENKTELEMTWDGGDEDEVNDDLMFHMEEIFGDDEDE